MFDTLLSLVLAILVATSVGIGCYLAGSENAKEKMCAEAGLIYLRGHDGCFKIEKKQLEGK